MDFGIKDAAVMEEDVNLDINKLAGKIKHVFQDLKLSAQSKKNIKKDQN